MDYKGYIESNIGNIDSYHMNLLLKQEKELSLKIKKLSPKFPPRWSNRVCLMLEIFKEFMEGKESNISKDTVHMITLVLLYLVEPADLIPDFIPFIGYVDDESIVELGWLEVEAELMTLIEKKGENLKDYF